jgi:microcompartment protein CcmK/EutM
VLDLIGARMGSTVIVSTDGDLARAALGNTAPVRMAVVGIVDSVHVPNGAEAGGQ